VETDSAGADDLRWGEAGGLGVAENRGGMDWNGSMQGGATLY
jgi:hypothetical protein